MALNYYVNRRSGLQRTMPRRTGGEYIRNRAVYNLPLLLLRLQPQQACPYICAQP